MQQSVSHKRWYILPFTIGSLLAFSMYILSVRQTRSNGRFAQTSVAIAFDTSMQTKANQSVINQPGNKQLLDFFRALYDKNNMRNVIPSLSLKIPKYIHIIWLGSKLPDEYEEYYATWRTFHPDWTIIFWTDSVENYSKGSIVLTSFDDLSELLLDEDHHKNIVVHAGDNLRFNNGIFFNKSNNYGERSDILKWEIIYRFGGVYVDTDHECLKPIDILHYTYDFYTGLQPLDTNRVQLGAALFAAKPKHPILKVCVETIKYRQHIVQIIAKTGPLHFTECMLHNAGIDNNIDIAFPATFFYPCSYEQKDEDRSVWMKDEAFAIHHWAGSWLKPSGFVKH